MVLKATEIPDRIGQKCMLLIKNMPQMATDSFGPNSTFQRLKYVNFQYGKVFLYYWRYFVGYKKHIRGDIVKLTVWKRQEQLLVPGDVI